VHGDLLVVFGCAPFVGPWAAPGGEKTKESLAMQGIIAYDVSPRMHRVNGVRAQRKTDAETKRPAQRPVEAERRPETWKAGKG